MASKKEETKKQPPNDFPPCPNCGAYLEQRKCKLLCPRVGCGYFASCSDFE